MFHQPGIHRLPQFGRRLGANQFLSGGTLVGHAPVLTLLKHLSKIFVDGRAHRVLNTL
jgi:hypothetical protein